MNNIKTLIGLAGGLAIASTPNMRIEDYEPINFPKGKTHPKAGKSNPLRGYYSRYTHGMSEYLAEKNQAKIANGETGFKGFRKVRKFIPSGNHEAHPNKGMTIWVHA